LLFEYHENDLEKDIKMRALQDQYYTEEEIWYIAESLILAMAYLQENKIKYGYLTPKNVFITATDPPVYKSFLFFLNKRDMTTYFQILSDQMPNVAYISPKLLSALKTKTMQPRHNEVKSDVFSLGMTLL
jgi:serine/threonine protein kinase